jgi:nitroreductase
MKKITLLLALSSVFVLGTGCSSINKQAWKAIGKDGDTIMKELGEAQQEMSKAQDKALEALGKKEEIADNEETFEGTTKTFSQKNAANLKERSVVIGEKNERLNEALAENPKLDAEGKLLMGEANLLMASATMKMVKNTTETVAVCIGIKELWESGNQAQKAVAAVLVAPAVTMASFVMKDMKAASKTVKTLRKYGQENGVPNSEPNDELDIGLTSLDSTPTEGLPTDADTKKAEEEAKEEDSGKKKKGFLGGLLGK